MSSLRRGAPLGLMRLDDRLAPAVLAAPDFYSASEGQVLTVTPPTGVLANDQSQQTDGAVLVAGVVGRIVGVDANGNILPGALPEGTLTFAGNGSFTLVVPDDLPGTVSKLQFTYRASNTTEPTEQSGTSTVTINIIGNSGQFYAAGADAGGEPIVKVYDVTTSQLRYTFSAYEESFRGGVRVAVADMNGDGIDDIITAPGVGGGARIKVFSGADLAVLFDNDDLFADPGFRGGAYVAAGDVDGDDSNELIVGAGEGGGPRVSAFSFGQFGIGQGQPFVKLLDFFAYNSGFRNGVRVAAGDLANAGRDFIVTAPGRGGGPNVKTFDFVSVAQSGAAEPAAALSFFAGNELNRDGLNIATGTFRAVGREDIVVGTAEGVGSVSLYDGLSGVSYRQFNVPDNQIETPLGQGTPPNGFSTFGFTNAVETDSGTLLLPNQAPTSLVSISPTSRAVPAGTQLGGARVAAIDVDGDGIDDVVTASGPGNYARVRVFRSSDNTELTNFLAFDSTFLGGVQVGG